MRISLYTADSGLPVVSMAHELSPDVILLDIMMPGLNGFEVCNMLKNDYEVQDIPVIMVTAKTESTDLKQALDMGAYDYIKKPIDEVEVVARVQSALRCKQQQDKLKEMATRDRLTELYNHALLIELLDKEIRKQERSGESISFVMLDIDLFKRVNDTYGHTAGDYVLKQFADILVQFTRRSDIVGRYGGEEFGIVLPDIDVEDTLHLCERIRKAVENFDFRFSAQRIGVTVSIGVYNKSPGDTIDMQEMISKADEALYRAKQGGRNRVELAG